jgi:hypothetical protein
MWGRGRDHLLRTLNGESYILSARIRIFAPQAYQGI